MISQAVKTFLQRPHSGALMISGAWGSGKSYFVKNTLLGEIKEVEIPQGIETENPAVAERLRQMLENVGSDACSHYYPFVTSLFGKSSISDIEKEIVANWIDQLSKGYVNATKKVLKQAAKLATKSKKINDWFDFSSLLDYNPGVSALPRNSVIILDDLERKGVDEKEILGFVNNLSENLGFKVIVVCNEEYLDRKGTSLVDFKEKVVEKTLHFKLDTKVVVNEIAKGYSNAEFSEFLNRDEIAKSISLTNPLASKLPRHARALINLRTLKFVLSHFYSIYCDIQNASADLNLTDAFKDEFLLNAWMGVLAISLELKAGHISTDNLRGLDEREFVEVSVDPLGQGMLKYPELGLYEQEPTEEEIKKFRSKDLDYVAQFYDCYFVRRSINNLHQILLPSVVHYVVSGIPFEVDKLLSEYNERKLHIFPPSHNTAADRELASLIQGYGSMDNMTFTTTLNTIVIDVDEKKGEAFTSIEGYINAYTFAMGFADLLEFTKQDELYDMFKTATDDWMQRHQDLDPLTKSRLEMMGSALEDRNAKELHRHVMHRVRHFEEKANGEAKQALITLFKENIPEFCAEICPYLKGNQIFSVPYYGHHPLLHEIPVEEINRKVAEIEIRDVQALQGLLTHRYNIDGNTELRDTERTFWQRLKSAYEANADAHLPGIIQFRLTLLPLLG